MDIIIKVVGVNFAVLVIYFFAVSFIGGFEAKILQIALLGMVFIPVHFVVCIMKAFNKKFSEDVTIEQRKVYKKAHLLSAVVVLIIGFSVCTTGYG